MTLPGRLIKVNDNIQITNTREQLMKDTTKKKAFIFKGYKTEKERIVRNNTIFNLCNRKITLKITYF